MGRRPCCSKEGVNRGSWSALEDSILTSYIQTHGQGKWRDLPKRAGLRRCGKSCRLRWLNYLRPDIKRGNISPEEEDLIIRLHNLLGNRWSLIAGRLPGRTDNEIKNYWNTCLSKRMMDGQSSKASAQERIKRRQSTSMECESETHQVIRTKAVRCTKVFLPPPQRDITPLPTPLEDDCPNFLMDFDMGQLFASDHMLDTDHLQSIQANSFRIGDGGGNNVLSSGIDEPSSFSEDLLDDWREITAIQDGLGLELELLDLSLIMNEEYPN